MAENAKAREIKTAQASNVQTLRVSYASGTEAFYQIKPGFWEGFKDTGGFDGWLYLPDEEVCINLALVEEIALADLVHPEDDESGGPAHTQ